LTYDLFNSHGGAQHGQPQVPDLRPRRPHDWCAFLSLPLFSSSRLLISKNLQVLYIFLSILFNFIPARRLWREYYADVDGVVFLIDTTDRERFAESKTELDVSFRL